MRWLSGVLTYDAKLEQIWRVLERMYDTWVRILAILKSVYVHLINAHCGDSLGNFTPSFGPSSFKGSRRMVSSGGMDKLLGSSLLSNWLSTSLMGKPPGDVFCEVSYELQDSVMQLRILEVIISVWFLLCHLSSTRWSRPLWYWVSFPMRSVFVFSSDVAVVETCFECQGFIGLASFGT
ncbi:hypothetical protein FNV43_RR16953 [Rhamnella rubrinervis]|uniref:Uncharacterized protein n=1 Tax=Rhamnella rubrinervis TaxID=2594499 RepID=A0A8K0ME12_9ROSA|nr:hypothetical protein FNV43_RR16953 [Rhamnella rubrinervis]